MNNRVALEVLRGVSTVYKSVPNAVATGAPILEEAEVRFSEL